MPIDALSVLCAQLTRDLLAIAKFLFTEIWRYIDFQNGGRPPSWNCFTTIRDHPRSFCYWPQLPVKVHVNVIHTTEDSYLIFSHIWLEMSIQDPKMGLLEDFGPLNVIIHYRDPQKGISLRKSASFKLSTIKIRWGVWPVGELTESVTDTQTDRHTQLKLYSFHALHCSAWPRLHVHHWIQYPGTG